MAKAHLNQRPHFRDLKIFIEPHFNNWVRYYINKGQGSKFWKDFFMEVMRDLKNNIEDLFLILKAYLLARWINHNAFI